MRYINILLIPYALFALNTNFYQQGMEEYKNKNFQVSYEMFSKIFLDHLSDINFNFTYGKSAYESGHYEMALAAFQRVEIQSPSNIKNKLEMARTYYMLKMYEDAQYIFEDVLAEPNIPQNIRVNIEFSLAKINKVRQKSFTYARGIVDVLYDSNVNYGSVSSYQYAGGTLPAVESYDDIALQLFVNVVNIYDIGSKNGFAIKNSFSAYSKNYLDIHEYNLQYLSYNPSLLYKDTKYILEMGLGIDTTYLDNKEYLNTLSFTPSVRYGLSPTRTFLTHIRYQAKRFQQKGLETLDANRVELLMGLQDILTPRSYINFTLIGANESKVKGDNINVDFYEGKMNVTYANQFTSDYGMQLFAQIKYRDYMDYSYSFDSTRHDLFKKASANLTYAISSNLSATLKTSYEHVNSNQDRFTYEKYTLSAGVIKTF